MQLSNHFSLREATYSKVAEDRKIDNSPTPEILERMKYTAIKMEAVRQLLGSNSIRVTSWFRGPALNKLVGGTPTSQHSKGEAVDFKCLAFGSPRDICLELRKHKDVLQYDQLILEPTWVHISFTPGNPRMKELTYLGKNHYVPGIS